MDQLARISCGGAHVDDRRLVVIVDNFGHRISFRVRAAGEVQGFLAGN